MQRIMLVMVVAGTLLTAGVAANAQASAVGQDPAAWHGGQVTREALEQLASLYEGLQGSVRGLSTTFEKLRMAAFYGGYPVDALGLERVVRDVALLLLGPEEANGDAAADISPHGFLLGEGGGIARFRGALDEYLTFWESYSDILVDVYARECLRTHGAEGCSAAAGTIVKEGQTRFLSTLADRVDTLANAALEALRRVEGNASLAQAACEFAAIYSCAVTAVGYWPLLVGGSLPSPDTLPSTLRDFLGLLENMHYDLYDELADRVLGS